ncbi:MAG: CopG family transcriptional regulator [Armatimonadota bacterium]|nr:CopG family transcriptional regulator [Armatimonadota bacterium]
MVRTQIQLTDEQAEKARQAARRMGISMAELIRRALDESLASAGSQVSAKKRSLRAIGCVASGTGDLSENHDKYLREAYNK